MPGGPVVAKKDGMVQFVMVGQRAGMAFLSAGGAHSIIEREGQLAVTQYG